MSVKPTFCPSCKINTLVEVGDELVCEYCSYRRPKVKR